jgi:hypothetical protein
MSDTLQTKSFGPLVVKDVVKGEVQAVVNTLNIVDRDGDVILPGAILDGSIVKMSAYGHDTILEGAPPAGMGTVTEKENQMVLSGRFFLGTQRGRESFEIVRETAEHGEWSIGYRNVKTAPMTEEWKSAGARRVIASLDLIEVSPVFEGANQMTGTLAVKSEDPDAAVKAEVAAAAEAEAEEGRKAAEQRAKDEEVMRVLAERQSEADQRDAEAKAARLRLMAEEERERFERNLRRFGGGR